MKKVAISQGDSEAKTLIAGKAVETVTNFYSNDDDPPPSGQAREMEEPGGPKIQLAMWELRVNNGFGGIVLSPVGTQCVSREDYSLINRKGLPVVDCTWARLDDVPFVKLHCSTPCLCSGTGVPEEKEDPEKSILKSHDETANLLLGKFKWGHAFVSLNRELLMAYSECQNSADIISVQNSWLSQQTQLPKFPTEVEGAEKSSPSEDEGSCDSDGRLPPHERNTNHLNLQDEETDEESE